MYTAAADVTKGLANAFRNAPIQGTVADAVELAFAWLHRRLQKEFPTAHVILSVHDSVVVECDLHDAYAVSDLLREEMERALARYCPDVVVKADVDIQASLDAKRDKVDKAMYDYLVEASAAAAEPISTQELMDRFKNRPTIMEV